MSFRENVLKKWMGGCRLAGVRFILCPRGVQAELSQAHGKDFGKTCSSLGVG